MKTEPLLKNEENRTTKQSSQFDAINDANLLTAQAWRVRENFKRLFEQTGYLNLIEVYEKWMKNALQTGVEYVVDVVKTFERHLEGIFNAILYKTTK